MAKVQLPAPGWQLGFECYIVKMKTTLRANGIFGVLLTIYLGCSSPHAMAEPEVTPAETPAPIDDDAWRGEWPVFKDFAVYPPEIQDIVRLALRTHDQQLTYKFGSADPEQGGMDCSGAVYYVLTKLGWKDVPRPSDGFYRWVWEDGNFSAVNGTTFESYEWQNLKPGDLVFWVGTYDVDAKRDPPISHVMIYLGEDEKTGERVIFGASEGRRYKGERRSGVGLFDFTLPPAAAFAEAGPQFIGYAPIPASAAPKKPAS